MISELNDVMEKQKKTVFITAAVFSALYIITGIATSDMYIAVINVILWGCMCFGYNWAKMSKVLLNIIVVCVYLCAVVQMILQQNNSVEISPVLIFKTFVNVIIPAAEIIIIYKSKNISDYFLDSKKNKINTKLK